MRVPIYRCKLVRDSSQAKAPRTCSAPKESAALFREFIGDGADEEHFVRAALDARRRVIGLSLVSLGTLSASLVHPREVFEPAILLNAAAIVVCHNHPSGDCAPSAEDREATRRLAKAGELLGVPLLDHVILGEGGAFFSFRDSGLL